MHKLLPLLFLAACSYNAVAESWVGRPADELVMSWGAPDRDSAMPNGGHEVRYDHSRLGSNGTLYCTARFLTDAGGVIVKVDVEGNVGGCNRLLRSKGDD